MRATHRTSLVFSYDSERVATAIARTLSVETGEIEGGRTRARLERDGATVRITVTATDLTALRAGTNSWTTLIEVAERATEAGADAATLDE
ncbi:hypotheical conserved protein [Halarchaeum acidiphilum MH1-52-1]|uniref:Hypotheical conserved protein n=1 Tax=Halarchaeum acidiphilum MH1-52-1 TaxID=1261545 RepID=U2YTI4_9EURY|nr:KEOPS complex subunit Pcc1 [Halarchaeum acidiphilum]GAD52067.1 hypotheical conserved protein [Halarchaeum acidiphilum MH1-52-1]